MPGSRPKRRLLDVTPEVLVVDEEDVGDKDAGDRSMRRKH